MYEAAVPTAECIEWEPYVDLLSKSTPGISTILTYILVTTQIPDLRLVKRTSRQIIVSKLTECFEIAIPGAISRRATCYSVLVADLNDTRYIASLFTIEVSSRGLIDSDMTMTMTMTIFYLTIFLQVI